MRYFLRTRHRGLSALAAGILGGLGPGAGLRAHNAATNPGPRTGAYMVYDSTHGRALLFGGWTRTAGGRVTYPNDLWERDGTRWRQITETGIQRILHPVATYDPTRGRVVLYGSGVVGEAGAFAGMSRTLWEWNGRHWAARDTSGPPDQIPAAAVGTKDGVVFLVSGTAGANRDAPRIASRTWRWGDAWSEREEGLPFNKLQAAAGATDGTIYFYQAWESWVTSPFLHVRDGAGTWRRIEVNPNPGVRNTVRGCDVFVLRDGLIVRKDAFRKTFA